MPFRNEEFNIIVCGVGGQGNILVSRLVGRVMSRKGFSVTIGETFGAAQRNGAVYSSLRISSQGFLGPLIPQGGGDVILGLEPMEALRMLSMYGNENIVTITNTEPIYPASVVSGRASYPSIVDLESAMRVLSKQAWFLNATEKAKTLNSPISANIIMLGALVGSRTMPLNMEEAEKEIEATFPKPKVDQNLEALRLGYHEVSAR